MLHLCIIGMSYTLVSLVLLKFIPLPYIWLCLVWGGSFGYLAISGKKSSQRLLCIYISIIFLVFGTYEAFLWFQIQFREEVPSVYEEFSQECVEEQHDILGYAPRKNIEVSHLKKHDNEVDFDVIYTIDSAGLRISPPYSLDCHKSILFFGGSMTFGEGVEDRETLPYIVGAKTHGEYYIHNFGFRGYGPHQMLSALEHHLVDSIVEVSPRYVIYQAFPDHIRRAAGFAKWDPHGPKYILNKEGGLGYAGHFDDRKQSVNGKLTIRQRLKYQLIKSLIIKKIIEKYQYYYRIFSEENIHLFVEIVERSREILQSRYANCEFHVLFWDSEDRISQRAIEELDRKGLNVHLMSYILPDYQKKRHSAYSLSQYDAHPSPLAYKRIADYVTHKILGL